MNDRLLNLEEVAKYLGVSIRTVRRQAGEGKIAYVKVGGQIRFKPESVVAYVERQSTPEPSR